MEKITRNSRKTPENIETQEIKEPIYNNDSQIDLEATREIVLDIEPDSEETLTEEAPAQETEVEITDEEVSEGEITEPMVQEAESDIEIPKKTERKRNSKDKKRKKVYTKIIGYLIILAILGLAVFGIYKGINAVTTYLASKVEVAEIKELTINSTGNLAYEKFQRGVLVANEGSISYHNAKNEVVWEKTAFAGSPVIKTNDRYALVSYTGTPNALLVNGSSTIPVTGNGNIVTSCINKNGYFALVMSEEGYKNQIVVFDNYGQVIYKWHSAENYVTCVAISPDNKNMAASTIGFGGNKFSNGVMIFDFAQEKPFAGQQEEDNIVMNIEYVSKRRLVVIGDKNTSYYKTNGKKIKDIDYEGKHLTTYDVCNSGTTVLCFSKDDSAMSNSDIYSYSKSGRQKGHFETEGKALSISCDGGNILVAREREFDVLNEYCTKKASVTVLKDIKNSVLFDNGNYAFVISGNTLRVIKV